jgi:hypothetical protein
MTRSIGLKGSSYRTAQTQMLARPSVGVIRTLLVSFCIASKTARLTTTHVCSKRALSLSVKEFTGNMLMPFSLPSFTQAWGTENMHSLG